MHEIIAKVLAHSKKITGRGLSSSATIGAAIVNSRPIKLQTPVELILL